MWPMAGLLGHDPAYGMEPGQTITILKMEECIMGSKEQVKPANTVASEEDDFKDAEENGEDGCERSIMDVKGA